MYALPDYDLSMILQINKQLKNFAILRDDLLKLATKFENVTRANLSKSCDSSTQTEGNKNIHVLTVGGYGVTGPTSNVSKFFEKNICWYGKNGTNCKFRHPKMCKKFSEYGNSTNGCKKGKGCDYLHPVLCKYALKYGACFNKNL